MVESNRLREHMHPRWSIGKTLTLSVALCLWIVVLYRGKPTSITIQSSNEYSDIPSGPYSWGWLEWTEPPPPRGATRKSKIISSKTSGFTDWETRSISTETRRKATCDPPDGIPKRCCLGSISRGGRIFWESGLCSHEANKFTTGYDDGFTRNAAGMTEVLKALAQRKQSLMFIGDSLMYQFAVAAECDWLRRGCSQDYTSYNSSQKEEKDFRYNTGVTEFWNVTCSSFQSMDEFVTVHFHLQYRPHRKPYDLDSILSGFDGVVVINFGAHYLISAVGEDGRVFDPAGGPAIYEEEMRKVFRTLALWQRTGHNRTVVWREQFAQHIDSDSGEWDADHGTEGCTIDVHFTDRAPRQWRDKIIRKVAAELGVSVNVLPAFNYTLSKPFNHPGFGKNGTTLDDSCERTHYCHNPIFWDPLIERLANIVNQEK